MSTRDEMIQTVVKAWSNARTKDRDHPPEHDAAIAVDALHPRQRANVPLPDGGRMEWHSECAHSRDEYPRWIRFTDNGAVLFSFKHLSLFSLPDDLHAECYKLRGREWVEASEDSVDSICRCGNDITNAANHRCDQCRRSIFGNTPAPTNATPLGFANLYKAHTNDVGEIYATPEAAGREALGVHEQYTETEVPVYRHAQTESELIAALEGCGYTQTGAWVSSHGSKGMTFTKRAGGGK